MTASRLIPTADTTRHAHYVSNGVIMIPGLIPEEEIAELRKTFTKQVESGSNIAKFDSHLAPDDVLSKYYRFVHPHRHVDTPSGALARKYMVDDRIFNIVEDLIGPAYGAQSMFYFKPPTARGQALHQDNFFLRAHPETCLAAWVAVDDCDGDNGGLMVIPGSHINEIMCHGEADVTQSFSKSTIKGLPDSAERIQTIMKAGDALFFHGSMVHGSKPNTTTDRFRRSLIFHYIPQQSQEIAQFYQPLVARNGDEVRIGEAVGGGPCGEAWREES